MSNPTAQPSVKSPQLPQISLMTQPQQTSVPAIGPPTTSNLTTSQQSPLAMSPVAGPGQHQHAPSTNAQPTGQYIAPSISSPPQSYQYPQSQRPPLQYQHAQTTITGSTTNPSLTTHHIQHVATMPTQNLPSQPAMQYTASYQQPQAHMQSQTHIKSQTQVQSQTQMQSPTQMQSQSNNFRQSVPVINEKQQSSVQVREVFTAQPQPVKGMEFAEMSEEERKKQRRKEQIASARHCAGQTCIITGKICIVSWTVMAAVCSVVTCLVNCLPGDSVGIMGGDSGGFGFASD